MTFRTARAQKKRAAAEQAPFLHSSERADLESLVEEHILGAGDVAATSRWHPSRRGNSPSGERRSKDRS